MRSIPHCDRALDSRCPAGPAMTTREAPRLVKLQLTINTICRGTLHRGSSLFGGGVEVVCSNRHHSEATHKRAVSHKRRSPVARSASPQTNSATLNGFRYPEDLAVQ